MTLPRPVAEARGPDVWWRGADALWLFRERPAELLAHFRSPACRLPESLREPFISDLAKAIADAEAYQAEHWGEDAEAVRRTESARAEARALDLWFAALG